MGLIRPGDLNRRIAFQRKTADAGFDSAGEEQWALVAEVWAEVQDVLPSHGERIADGLSIESRPARIRTLYRADVNGDMRIAVLRRVPNGDGTSSMQVDRTMQIVAGPVELGRREGLEMMAEDYSTRGGTA